MPSKTYLMLRSAPLRDAACGGSSGQRTRLEARTILLAADISLSPRFFDTRERGGPGRPLRRLDPWIPRLPPRHLRGGGTCAVKLGNDVHLIRRQLHRNRAHLLVDVVLTKPLGEGRELALDIGRLLGLQLRRPELMVARTVTGGARGDPACGVAGKSQANGAVVFAKRMPGFKMLADKGRQAVAAACE